MDVGAALATAAVALDRGAALAAAGVGPRLPNVVVVTPRPFVRSRPFPRRMAPKGLRRLRVLLRLGEAVNDGLKRSRKCETFLAAIRTPSRSGSRQWSL